MSDDDPFLAKMRGQAQEDPFLAKVRAPAEGDDPFLAKIRGGATAVAEPPKRTYFVGVSTTPDGTVAPEAGPAFKRPELETQKAERRARMADERAVSEFTDPAVGRVANAVQAAVDPVAAMFRREGEAQEKGRLYQQGETNRTLWELQAPPESDTLRGKLSPQFRVQPESYVGAAPPPGYLSRIWTNVKATPEATIAAQPESVVLGAIDPGIMQAATENVIRPVTRGVGRIAQGLADAPENLFRSATDSYPRADEIRDADAQVKPEDRTVGSIASGLAEFAAQAGLLHGVGKAAGAVGRGAGGLLERAAAGEAGVRPTPEPAPAPRPQDVPATPSAQLPTDATAPPTGGAGVTLAANVPPGLAKKLEGSIDLPNKPWRAAVEAVGKKIAEKAPGLARVADAAYGKLFRSEESEVGKKAGVPGFEGAAAEARKVGREASQQARKAVVEFEGLTKPLTNPQILELGKSLSSEPADLSFLSDAQKAKLESVRAVLQDLRARDKLSEEAFAEYPMGHLTRLLKGGLLGSIQRGFARTGSKSVGPYHMAMDMPSVRLEIPEGEAQALVSEMGAKPRYLKEQDGKTLIKFDNTPEGAAARDAFLDAVRDKFASARSKLAGDATREIKAGDVQQAKMFQNAQQDVPRLSDLGIEKFDPVPEDVAAKIFNPDPAQRLHVTTQTSASRIGKAALHDRIMELKDENGESVVRTPKSANEVPPKGYELLSNKKFGPLHGKFVPTPIAEYLRGTSNPSTSGFFKEMSAGLMERFKVARLLYNPRQWFRQMPSNMEFENYAGISNWNPRYLEHKAKGLAAMREGSPYHADLVANGFLDPAYVSNAELGLAESALTEGGGSIGRRVGRAIGSFGMTELAPNKLGALEAKLGRAYGFADAWTKATIYRHAIEEMGMTPEQAAAHVRKWTPSPEAVSSVIKNYSRHITGDPWARYRAEQWRITMQGAKDAPVRAIMNRYQKNLIRAAFLAGGSSKLSEDERQAMENEQGGGALSVGRDEQGRPLGVDYSFLSTATDLFDTPSEIGKGGEHIWERAQDITGLGDNPTFQFASEQLTRHDKRGNPINPEGTIGGVFTALLQGAAKPFTPSLANEHAHKLAAAWQDKPYSPNAPPQTKAQAIMDVFFGFKLTPLDADQALTKLGRQGRTAIEDLKSKYGKMAIREQEFDDEEIGRAADAIAAEYEQRAAPLERIAPTQTPPK